MQKYLVLLVIIGMGCSKKGADEPTGPVVPLSMQLSAARVDGVAGSTDYFINNFRPVIEFVFSTKTDRSTVASGISFTNPLGGVVAYDVSFTRADSGITIQPKEGQLNDLTLYNIRLNKNLKSPDGAVLAAERTFTITTPLDTLPKFPAISDDSLMTMVQRQTFKYFWEFGHPVSGMARERNTSLETVTSGGTGFGIMAMVAAVNRGFITRPQAVERVDKIATFLTEKTTRYKGAFAHWMNGTTGNTIAFSANDNGADLVETSFLMMGLLTARQYFDGATTQEVALGQKITKLYNEVQWNWFRKNGENQLYWHWSPDKEWAISLRIRGWNECLITYVLAAGSPTYAISDSVYKEGWANNGNMRNGNSYFGIQLPLGSAQGGPLFLSHYSFLGINPNSLTDVYANYQTQNRAHSLINYNYCVANPSGKRGYSNQCWGLTASDIPGGYTASSPTNDRGVIAPTAAIGSMPYTPVESMRAMRFFYNNMGNRLWKEYGFIDAFSIHERWFASSFLAIDQGPQIIMIENHRSGLLWNLGMQVPEVRNGLNKLGFSSPFL